MLALFQRVVSMAAPGPSRLSSYWYRRDARLAVVAEEHAGEVRAAPAATTPLGVRPGRQAQSLLPTVEGVGSRPPRRDLHAIQGGLMALLALGLAA